jgi:hypothetical protein
MAGMAASVQWVPHVAAEIYLIIPKIVQGATMDPNLSWDSQRLALFTTLEGS